MTLNYVFFWLIIWLFAGWPLTVPALVSFVAALVIDLVLPRANIRRE